MSRFARWPTREQAEARAKEVARAGGVVAWIRSASSAEIEAHRIRDQQKRNALAQACGLNIPYPDVGLPEGE